MATGTNKPVGSTDPRDLLANADNLDTAVNGDAKEWTDRLGRRRATMKGVEDAVPQALVARDQAQSAAEAAVLARDGALAGAEIYPTEAAGRAAVADGQTFNVQGSGDVAAYQYRRSNAAVSALIATFPAADAIFKPSRESGNQLPIDVFPMGYAVSDYYARVSDGLISTAAGTACAIVPVLPGKKYRFRAASYQASALVIVCISTATPVLGAPLARLTLDPGLYPGERLITIPNNAQAKFILINTYLPTLSWDIRGTVSLKPVEVDEFKAGARLQGFALADEFSDGSDDSIAKSITGVPGWYVYMGSLPAYVNKLVPEASVEMGMFPVRAGGVYRITAADLRAGFMGVALRTDANYEAQTTISGPVALETETPTSRLLRIPAGSTAKWAFINTVVGAGFDIRASLRIIEVSEFGAFAGARFADVVARRTMQASGAARLRGKRWAVIGDSITEKNFRANKNYHDFISEAVGGIVIDNKGISGTGYYGRHDVASTIGTTPDAITVFLGTNDWGGVGAASTMPLGVFGDTTTATVAGCIHKLLSGLIAAFPAVPIGVATPLPRLDCWGDPGTANNRSYTLRQLSDLIIRHAKHFSLPWLDLYAESGLPVFDSAGNAHFFTAPGAPSPDGLHPNDAGQAVMARKFMTLLGRL